MASYTIPEDVIGVPLFVPDGHDYFSIATAAMPNGDDALAVAGATSTDYKAFQPVQSVTPPIFDGRLTLGQSYCMSLWIRVQDPGANTNNAPILTCETLNGNKSTGSDISASSTFWLALSRTTTPRLIHYRRQGNNDISASPTAILSAFNTWFLICVNVTVYELNTRTLITEICVNDDPNPASLQDGGGTSTSGFDPEPYYFCIGSYSDVDAPFFDQGGAPIDFEIGKLAFFDHALNATERALLYLSMTA